MIYAQIIFLIGLALWLVLIIAAVAAILHNTKPGTWNDE